MRAPGLSHPHLQTQTAEAEAATLQAPARLSSTPLGPDCPLSTLSTPVARLLASARSRLARLELELASEAALHADGDCEARRLAPPDLPGLGPPPPALLKFLEAPAEEGAAGGGLAWEDWALLHSTSAAAAAGSGPAAALVRSAALAAAGEALRVKALRASATSAAPAEAVPAGSGREAPEPLQTSSAGNGAATAAPLGHPWRDQSIASLRSAVHTALNADDHSTARRAALTLARWHREAGEPLAAAEWVAVAQGAAAASELEGIFLTAADGETHPEVLAWRQYQAAASAGGSGTGPTALVEQVCCLRQSAWPTRMVLSCATPTQRHAHAFRRSQLVRPPHLSPSTSRTIHRPPRLPHQRAPRAPACATLLCRCSRRYSPGCHRARACCFSTTTRQQASSCWLPPSRHRRPRLRAPALLLLQLQRHQPRPQPQSR
jgi:hypothetical protein